MSARERIADVLSRVYDARPLAWQSPEHAAHHTEAADRLLAAGLADRAAVLAEAKREVTAWLVKKAREGTPVERLASKVDRGAIRLFFDAEAGKDSPAGAESTQGAELTVYRAAYEHDITPLETYTLQAAARCHCEDEALTGLARDEVALHWKTDPDEPEVQELHVGGEATGYTVTAVTIASAYDPEAGR